MTPQLPKPRNPDPLVIKVLQEHRAKLDDMETVLMESMGKKWLGIERGLEADISALAQEMARRRDAGEVITQQMVWRADRYQIIKGKMADEIKRYNQLYAVGTISDAQRQYAILGINAAQDAIIAQYPSPLSAAFNQINVGAVESMIGFAGDGSPLYDLLKASYGDATNGLLDGLINGLARGQSATQIAGYMANGMGMGLDRALLIALTESSRAYRTGSTKQYRDSGVVTGFIRLVKKATACAACLMLDGEHIDIMDELTDHPRGKAELPGNLILSSAPSAFVTLYHKGDIIIIHTASGKFLAVTPRHPILTRRGWVGAAFVKKGDDVISYNGADWASGIMSPNKNHIPTLVEEIPAAFDMLRLGSVPTTAKNLYSDREDGEVEVIWANRLLWNSLNVAGRQQIKEDLFGVRHFTRHFNPISEITALFKSMMFSSRPFLGVGNRSFAFSRSHAIPAQRSGLGRCTPPNIGCPQSRSDHLSRNTQRLRERQFRFPRNIARSNITNWEFTQGAGGRFCSLNLLSFGFTPEQPLSLYQIREGMLRSIPPGGGDFNGITSKVVFDSVVNVDTRSFSGHVYSLQADSGWYLSNGIISHNCSVMAQIEGISAPTWHKGQDWFLEQDEDAQKKILGAEKFQLWQDGQIKLSDLARKTHSDVWGSSPRVPSIKELIGEG